MDTTFTELSEEEQTQVETEWKRGESGSSLDRKYGLKIGTVRSKAYRKGWVKDSVSWEEDLKTEKLKSKLRIVERKYKAAVKDVVAVDRFIDVAKDAIQAADPVVPMSLVKHSGSGEHRVVAMLSDLHVGEVVSAEETNNLSEYNLSIFVERIEKWTEKVIELVELRRARLNVPSLSIFMLGDIISGDIHEELQITNEGSVLDTVVFATRHLAASLLTLSKYFEEIEVSGVVGNHGRMKKKPYFKGKQRVSWDYLIYQMLALHLKDQKNIKWHIPASFWTVRDVLGMRFLLFHGDGIQSTQGLPYYGIERAYLRLRDLIGSDVPFDRAVMGHYHDPVDTERWHIGGNFKGGDEYSLGRLYKGCRPSQTLLYVHSEHGVVGTERIYLDNPSEHRLSISEDTWS